MITVIKVNDTTFEVTVEGRTVTTHKVTVTPEYYEELTGGKVTAEVLVEKSFEFLLAREPNTSILRSFDLPVIGRYFPEYERVISEMIE
jgi:ribosomal protein L24